MFTTIQEWLTMDDATKLVRTRIAVLAANYFGARLPVPTEDHWATMSEQSKQAALLNAEMEAGNWSLLGGAR